MGRSTAQFQFIIDECSLTSTTSPAEIGKKSAKYRLPRNSLEMEPRITTAKAINEDMLIDNGNEMIPMARAQFTRGGKHKKRLTKKHKKRLTKRK